MRGIVFSVLACLSIASFAADIETVRLWAGPDRTTVVFDVSEPLTYRLSAFKNPNRLVIDFLGTELPRSLKLPAVAGTPVKGLRYARRNNKDVRVVLDLEQRVSVGDSLLPPRKQYGHRLVLNLAPISKTSVAAKPRPPATPKLTKKRIASAGLRDIVIAVDAGHGGEDVGAIGPSGVYEKDIVLAISKALVAEINRYDGMRGVLVRARHVLAIQRRQYSGGSTWVVRCVLHSVMQNCLGRNRQGVRTCLVVTREPHVT